MASEKRLIDANALADVVDESKYNNPHCQGMVRVNHRNEHDHFLRMILDAPTVDAVEVVRCIDCKYCRTFFPEKEIGKEARQVWYCDLYRCNRKTDEFCSDGERRQEA